MPVTLRDNPGGRSRDVAAHPYKVHCDKPNCFYVVAADSHEAGVALYDSHACPYIGGPTKIGWSVTLTTLEKCWIKLDSTMTELMEGNYDSAPEEKVRLKGVCRGMAEILAEFMGPHFRTPDEIAGEAMRRYKAKKAGEEYETPGLGHLRHQPPPGVDKYANDAKARPKAAAPAPKPAHKFTEDEVGSIKFAHESGMFTLEQLAKTYKVNVDAIKAVVGA